MEGILASENICLKKKGKRRERLQPGYSRRVLEQQPRQRARCQSQQRHAGQPEQQYRFPSCQYSLPSGMPASTDAGSVNELSSRLSCMPPGGIEYHPGSPRLVASAKSGGCLFFSSQCHRRFLKQPKKHIFTQVKQRFSVWNNFWPWLTCR